MRAWDAVATRDRPLWKNADLKSVIIAVIKNNDNNDNINCKNNNLFKKKRPQSLVHNKQMQAILKHKKYSEHLNFQNTGQEKSSRPCDQEKQVMFVKSKMKTLSVTRQKTRTTWITLFDME